MHRSSRSKEMTNLRVLSTSMVQARTNKEPTQRIELIPSDLTALLIGPIQKGLLFLKPKPSDTKQFGTSLVQHLKASLSCTLDFFYPLAGRIATVENEGNAVSVFIDCNNSGAEFVHAAADDVPTADILEPTYVPSIVYSFFPLNGITNIEGVSKPLLGIQVTELVDGIFIGSTINHSVVDGASFWNFFNSWSEISRGLDGISKPPAFGRCFLDSSYFPIRVPLPIEKVGNHELTPPFRERIFRFSKAKIAELKAKANAEAGTDKISSWQSLLSHVWRSVIRSRELDPDRETYLVFAIGIRPRLRPPLPEQYFGNAFVVGTVTLKEKELIEHGHGNAALQMQKEVARYSADKVKSSVASWIMKPQLLTPGGSSSSRFIASSSPRFNVYGNDFGWGRPIAVRSGSANKYGGKITVYPGVEEGSMDVEVCILPETSEAMGNDLEFMDTVIS